MHLASTKDGSLVGLPPRQAEALRLLCSGMGNKEIAEAMGIAESTVKSHLHQITRVIGKCTRLELLRWALERPEVFEGKFVEVDSHPAGCTCGAPYCRAMLNNRPA